MDAEKKLRTGLVSSARYLDHLPGEGHPERPERLQAILNSLCATDLDAQLFKIEPRRTTVEEITLAHTRTYFEMAKREIESGAWELSTGDTNVCRDSFDVALLAAGGACAAVDAVIGGKVQNAFCAMRPPGHHATADRGMGFCIFNNVAIAARYAQKKHGLERVLIADWDVHHGNGTQDIFYDDGSVFFFSTHQSPLYPSTGAANETGAGTGKGTTLNCPLSVGSGKKEIIGAFRDKLVPAMEKFKPELVLISAGFDSRRGDPLGGFLLDDEDFAELTKLMLDLARDHAKGRVVSMLEGGYNLTGLASAATAHVQALMQPE
jgi:acetoin utilization deacetylase AcuC-like enzyme